MREILVGNRIAEVECADDDIVFEGPSPAEYEAFLTGKTVQAVGRRGKFFWLDFGEPPFIGAHLGMAGWVREIGASTIRLRDHGNAPLDDESGRPRFLKLRLQTEQGRQVAMTDQRRFARIWMIPDLATDKSLKKLGPDAFDAMPSVSDLQKTFAKRNAAIKAVLLDQGFVAGIGNYLADEILYHSGVAPIRPAKELKAAEIKRIREKTHEILAHAVNVGADYEKFPANWLFHSRWGGDRGPEVIDGNPIVRTVVGGRTTAYVPKKQK
jgi:formamidopyrimidine-DNA glycosylase